MRSGPETRTIMESSRSGDHFPPQFAGFSWRGDDALPMPTRVERGREGLVARPHGWQPWGFFCFSPEERNTTFQAVSCRHSDAPPDARLFAIYCAGAQCIDEGRWPWAERRRPEGSSPFALAIRFSLATPTMRLGSRIRRVRSSTAPRAADPRRANL